MLNEIFTWLNSALYGNIYLASFASFTWGILSILLSPCHLSSIPLVVGYITTQGGISLKRTFSISLTFAFGILITIAILGLTTLLLGRLMGDIGTTGNYLVAAVFFVMGLYLLDLIKLPWNALGVSSTKYKGLTAAFLLGLLFGIGLGPCTFAFMAPVLGVVFQAASSEVMLPVALLTCFALGHCIVIAGAGTLSRAVQQYLNWTESSRLMTYTKRACGVLVILGGFYIIMNQY
ncbi:MAG TPA: cytochrome c biogenesis protein CcdA [Ignavibacteriales bacterium]|nr:cytochrome c biogenesis protein CcdA [Ignavibacteriales bacterium]